MVTDFMMQDNKHKCKFVETGYVRYSDPAQYQEKCSCGKVRWRMYKSITDKTIIYEHEDHEIRDEDLKFLLSEIAKRMRPK